MPVDTGDIGYGTLPDPSAGDEARPTSPGDAPGSDTTADSPKGRLNIALPDDLPGNGWRLRVIGVMTYRDGKKQLV